MITEVHPLFYINQLQLKYCGEIKRKTFKINNFHDKKLLYLCKKEEIIKNLTNILVYLLNLS